MLYIYIRSSLAPHLFMGYFSLIGLFLTEKYGDIQDRQSIKYKCLAVIICIGFLGTIYYIFNSQMIADQTSYLSHFKWILIGMSIPTSVALSNYFEKN